MRREDRPRSGPPSPAIEASGLSRRYGGRWALANFDLTLPWGCACVVAGRNGAGKSTLLRLLATAIGPHAGWGRVAGYDLRSQRREVRRSTALLSHHSYTYSALTALENLQVTARLLGRAAGRRDLLPLLDRMGLGGRADEPVAAFSAGMRKRLALARVLLQEAPVVLLDEPYGELDPGGFLLVDGLIRDLREGGAAVLLATHLVDRGAELCDLGVVLEAGRLAWSGPAGSLPLSPGLPARRLAEAAV